VGEAKGGTGEAMSRNRVPNAATTNMAPIRATAAERNRWKEAARRNGISLAEVARWAWDALDRGEIEIRRTEITEIRMKKTKP
jgi:hypothetical protein